MIVRLRGVLLELQDFHAVVDVGGVGYEVELTATALAHLPPRGGDCEIPTHYVVREDAHLLYGFASVDERDVFRMLIRINGVGPKLALNLLSSASLADLARAVAGRDVSVLTRIPGVGKKTAERLLVELKDKLNDHLLSTVDTGTAAPVSGVLASSAVAAEAVDALRALGYRLQEAERLVQAAQETGGNELDTPEALVRAALRRVAQKQEAAR